MPTTLTNGIQLPDKGSVDWYSSMQSNYNLIDTHLGDTDVHVTAEDKARWDGKQGSLSQAQLDAIAQVATNTSDITALQSGKADASHTHSSSDITDIDDYATKDYVDNSISGLVDNAPAALDTLNELSAALNDDSNFASTVTNALATKANSADLATVATSGSYTDLTDKPTINDSTITIQKNGSTVDTFTTNGSNKTINIPVPTKTSDLTNDSDFVVSSSLAAVATSGFYNDLDNKPYIPDKISDLIDDSNFVDTSNPAVASGITSAKVTDYDTHIADTDIHVTTADKNKWNNQTYVFRYSSTALTASSTNSNALLDNTDNLKVGDKVIDSNGVLFSITAIDTANSTFTIGTALIDLAQDSDVVHKSGDETISGVKSFINYLLGKDLSGQTVDLNDCVDAYSGAMHYYYAVSNYTNILNKPENKPFILESKTVRYVSSIDYIYYQKIYTADYNATPSIYTRYYRSGSSSWSNWVKDADKFVTTNTAQTITGIKTFLDVPIPFKSSTAELGVTGGSTNITFSDKNGKNLSGLTLGNYGSSKLSYARLNIFDKDTNNNEIQDTLEYAYVSNNNNAYLRVSRDNFCTLGTTSYRWKGVYAQSYYYGSNNVEFSTKFVTTDTNQTISGNKTFSSNVNVYNSDATATTPNLYLRSSKIELSSQGNTSGGQDLTYLDKNNTTYAYVKGAIQSNGSAIKIRAIAKDSSDNSVVNELQMLAYTNGNKAIFPTYSNEVDLGVSSYKWKSFNGVEPSSLSLPSGNVSDVIDISSYLVNLDGTDNTYIAPANGWITINMNNCSGIHATITGFWSDSRIRASAGAIKFLMPVLKNQTVNILIFGGTIDNARFIPCQGNV